MEIFPDIEYIEGAIASNGTLSPFEPITLEKLVSLQNELGAIFSDLPYKYGADMSRDTWEYLKSIIPTTNNSRDTATVMFGIDIHIVDKIPFGKVEECSCVKSRCKL